MGEAQEIASELVSRARLGLPRGLLEVRLFGSAARGTFTPESDIDLFVLVERRAPAVLDAVYDIAFDLTVSSRRDVSLKVYDRARYDHSRAAGSGFLRALERESVLLWSAPTQTRSRRTFARRGASSRPPGGSTQTGSTTTVSRGRVTRRIAPRERCCGSRGMRPRPHRGLVGLVGEHFVQTGELPRDLGRALRRDRDERENGDHDAFVEFDAQESAGVLRDAEEFVAAAEALIRGRLGAP